MEVNANFAERAVVHSRQLPWIRSPSPGVERRMLDRIGAEVARATSIVRYSPGSSFASHTHHGGEEYFVLEGVFSDEDGDHGPGSYVRNPPASMHTPRSADGCTIFVKLWQFDPSDHTSVRVDSVNSTYLDASHRPGVAILPLFEDAHEQVRLERWPPGADISLPASGGIELLVLEGSFIERGEAFEPGSWLRLPVDAPLHARVQSEGARLWIKTGHLTALRSPPEQRRLAGSATVL